jgi:hypothetical protein
MAGQDVALPKSKPKADFDSGALRTLPDTKVIHARLFTKQEAGDGPKQKNAF